VTASGPTGSASKTFNLTVTDGNKCGLYSDFAPASSINIGNWAEYVAIGDLNEDGRQDVVISRNTPANLVSIRLGNGSGGFATSGRVISIVGPKQIAIDDYNGDGHQDIAVTARETGVSIYLGDGQGGVSDYGSFASSLGWALESADFNNDRKLDLAFSGGGGSGTLNIRPGNGAGGFSYAPSTNFTTGRLSLAAGDFNSDGNVDLAGVNTAAHNVSVNFGDGLGGMALFGTVPTGANPIAVAVGDLNGDNNDDLAVANKGSGDTTVLLGNGSGGFLAAPSVGTGTEPRDVVISDFDNDGRGDLAITSLSGVSIRYGDGQGGFITGNQVSNGGPAYSAAVGDFNADGIQDLIVTSGTSGTTAAVRLGTCSSVTPTPSPMSSPTATPTVTPTLTPTPVLTPTPQPTATPTLTPTPVLTPTPQPTATPTGCFPFCSPTPTATPTPTPIPTATPTPTPSQTFIVNTLTDTQDATRGDSFCSDANGMCSLRSAISEGNAYPWSTTIILPAGTYTQEIFDVPENSNASGDWDITGDIKLQGAGADTTIIQAHQQRDQALERVLHCLGGAVISIDGVTVRNGRYVWLSTPDKGGAGILVEGLDTDLRLSNSVITDNVSQDRGGGIRVSTNFAKIRVDNSVISNNRSGSSIPGSRAGGGGVDIDGIFTFESPTHYITNTKITGNVTNTSVSTAYGGGLNNTCPRGTVYLTGSLVSNNQAIGSSTLFGFGGGIYNESARTEIKNCTVTENFAGDAGGGIRSHTTDLGIGAIGMVNSTVSNNSAPHAGGIMNTSGSLVLHYSTVNGNTALDANGQGGGIYNSSVDGISLVILLDSTISGNRAALGGGVYNQGTQGEVESEASTIASNTATISGGGLYQAASVATATDLLNSVVADNLAPNGPDLFGTISSSDYNHIENVSGSVLISKPHDVTGTDPKLGPLSNNGGPTLTHRPDSESPVLNTIPSTVFYCFGHVDQRGFRRLIGLGCDKGAVELTKAISDFDGDYRSDISVFRPAGGNWYINGSTAGNYGVQFGASSDKVRPADFDGDGRTDMVVYRPSEGTWYILKSSDGTYYASVFGLAEDVPVPADYNGDNKADVGVFRPSQGTWYIQYPNGQLRTYQFGQSGDVPAIGDFNGDSASDIAVFRPANGTWYRLNSSNGSFVAEQFGIATDRIVPADYFGYGKAEIAVFRPADGTWYIKNNTTGSYSIVNFGLADDIPAPGDYDGDGKADIAVFRPSNGTWYIANSANGSYTIQQFGLSGDIPTQSAFSP
jgi:hypothetical protein